MTGFSSSSNAYRPVPVEVALVTRETSDVKTFRFEMAEGARSMEFVPGQFVVLSILGVGECPIAIASSPTDGPWLEFTVRNLGKVTAALHKFPPRGSLGLRGPLGNGFDLEALRGRPLVLLAGGIGLAPLRSFVRLVNASRGDYGEVTILYGARTADRRLYRDELAQWRADGSVTLLEAVEEDDDGDWEGVLGTAADLVERVEGPLAGAAAVVCGPAEMIAPAVERLEARGVAGDDIQVTLERRMSCGIGKCGHCFIGDTLVCRDGPVFTARRLREMGNVI